jgi:hypothetical protein
MMVMGLTHSITQGIAVKTIIMRLFLGLGNHYTQRPRECIHGTTRSVDGCGIRASLVNILNIQVEKGFTSLNMHHETFNL